MGYRYDAICRSCETKFSVSEGSGMVAMPFHYDRCGTEWWWEFGPGGPIGEDPQPPPCGCGGKVQGGREGALPQLWLRGLRSGPGRSVDDLRLMATKICSKCRRMKDVNEFHRSATNSDGRTSRCKACRSEDGRLYVQRRHEAERAAEERAAGLARGGVDFDV
jgi:hypothetical protein